MPAEDISPALTIVVWLGVIAARVLTILIAS